MMKRSVILFFAFFPLFAVAQNGAVAMLDKAVAVIKSDAAVQMDYDYTVYDDDDVIVYSDNGTMRLDNDRYSLIMENMKVWCNGKVQWSYMKDIDEVYITDADSEEPRVSRRAAADRSAGSDSAVAVFCRCGQDCGCQQLYPEAGRYNRSGPAI